LVDLGVLGIHKALKERNIIIIVPNNQGGLAQFSKTSGASCSKGGLTLTHL
jgi:hypothetical protein